MNGHDDDSSQRRRQPASEVFVGEPNLADYLKFRDRHPHADVPVTYLITLENLAHLQDDMEQFGVHYLELMGIADGDVRCIDAVALKLIRALVSRGELSAAGVSHVQSRNQGIQDSLVNYLIMISLQSCNAQNVPPPPSLVMLLMDRLGGFAPDRYIQSKLAANKERAVWIAAQMLRAGDTISFRKIAALLNVQPSITVAFFEVF